ncbi:MAG TPA: flagellar basal body-associated FliL family protein [Opitutaceae bacterium]|nr:flagellar basal body-associated FliL family protein [Opitutaceae bacterium]
MAAAKTEAPPPAAAAKGKEDPAAAAAASTASAPAKGKGIAAFIPLIAVVVLAPVLSFAVVQFVMLPQLKKQLALPAEASLGKDAGAEEGHAEAAKEEKGGKEGKEGKGGKKEGGASNTYEFANVVVNLSGTMGTRYLKTTFLVTGEDKNLRGTFEGKKPQLLDVTLNVLSALSLSDLEEAGAKNLIREKLIVAYNQAIGKKTVEQIYFSDFVVQ